MDRIPFDVVRQFIIIVFWSLFFWAGGLWLMSFFGSWRFLAKKYQTNQECEGRSWRFSSVGIQSEFFKACIHVVECDQGLYLRPMHPFRFFHPPLLIPWNALERKANERVYYVDTARGPVALTFYGALGEALYVSKRVIVKAADVTVHGAVRRDGVA